MKEIDFTKCKECSRYELKEDDFPCDECLMEPGREYSTTPLYFYSSDKRETKKGFPTESIILENYLYSLKYDCINWKLAYDYYRTHDDVSNGACSVLRAGNLIGRKFDWKYDKTTEFIVETPGVIGVAGGFADISIDTFYVIPFQLRDGMNRSGLFMEMNVVPTDKGINDKSLPIKDIKYELSYLMLIRFILENFSTAKEAAEFIRDHVLIKFSSKLRNIGYDIHYYLADRLGHTYIVEFKNATPVILDVHDCPYMTNFHIMDVEFNDDGTVNTIETEGSPSANGITEYGSGLERYNLIVENIADISRIEDMYEFLQNLDYTRAYLTSPKVSNPYWYTEFVGGDLNVESRASDFNDIVTKAAQEFANRKRDGKTWQSVHTSIYDLERRCLWMYPQEKTEGYYLKL